MTRADGAREFAAQLLETERAGNRAVVEDIFNDVGDGRTPVAAEASAPFARQHERAGHAAALAIKGEAPATHAGELFAGVIHD